MTRALADTPRPVPLDLQSHGTERGLALCRTLVDRCGRLLASLAEMTATIRAAPELDGRSG